MTELASTTIKKILISALIGAIIGSIGTYAISSYQTTLHDRQEKYQMANAFLTEISGNEGGLCTANNITHDRIIRRFEYNTSIPSEKNTPNYPEKIYEYHYIYKSLVSPIPKSTLYSTFMKDTFKFQGFLPSELYVFYSNLQTAEDARQMILDMENRKAMGAEIPSFDESEVFLSDQYRTSLEISVNMIPQLKKDLEQEMENDKSLLP
jgi:hypothetical protein